MIKIGIYGASGITGGELIRLLINHPNAELKYLHSNSNNEMKITNIFKDLYGETELTFCNEIDFDDIDLLFLCLPHGKSKEILNKIEIPNNLKIIDLGNDFRLEKDSQLGNNQFIYGLVEANKHLIKKAKYIANPGCFATAIQLALLPLLKQKLLNRSIHINGTTGSTGAGSELTETNSFNWRLSNFSSYKQFHHQHLNEICETILKYQGNVPEINFIPNRGTFARGIFVNIYFESTENINYEELYNKYYSNSPFVFLLNDELNLKNVVNTNKCFINIKKYDNKILITSVIDNLIKGASGQAVQNMNLMFGLDETLGLKIKASVY